jgi:hypothetical protein
MAAWQWYLMAHEDAARGRRKRTIPQGNQGLVTKGQRTYHTRSDVDAWVSAIKLTLKQKRECERNTEFKF